MGSGTTVTCKSCECVWHISGDPSQYVRLDDGIFALCAHPLEVAVAEGLTKKSMKLLRKEQRLHGKIGCHCLNCFSHGDYSWNASGGEAFIFDDMAIADFGIGVKCITISPRRIRRCRWFQCASCGKRGQLLADGLIDMLLFPLTMLFGHKEQSPVRCPRCKIGYLQFAGWIS